MSSVMTLVQMRASVMALGSRLSILNLSKNGPLPAAAASRGLHAFVGGGEGNYRANNGGAEETSNGDSFLSHSQRPVFLQFNRWESSSSSSSAPLSESGTPICNHWSRQWEKDRLAKKRFSNEGRELRSLFTRRTAAELWKGVTSQSTAAAKSGRGKRGKLLRRYDLNRGQVMGWELCISLSPSAFSSVTHQFIILLSFCIFPVPTLSSSLPVLSSILSLLFQFSLFISFFRS